MKILTCLQLVTRESTSEIAQQNLLQFYQTSTSTAHNPTSRCDPHVAVVSMDQVDHRVMPTLAMQVIKQRIAPEDPISSARMLPSSLDQPNQTKHGSEYYPRVDVKNIVKSEPIFPHEGPSGKYSDTGDSGNSGKMIQPWQMME